MCPARRRPGERLRHPPLLALETEHAVTFFDPAGEPLHRERYTGWAIEACSARLPHLTGRDDVDLFLANGARLYRDNGCGLCNLEYATPECTSPDELIAHARAGERIVAQAVSDFAHTAEGVARGVVTKTNLDYRGTTNGSHENHLHTLAPEQLAEPLLPLLVSRVIVCGGGGFDDTSPGADFLCSPRVTHLEHAVSRGAQHDRAIYTIKDEDLSGGRYQRLQLLCSEGVRCERSERLRFGTVALSLRLLEAGAWSGPEIRLADPLAAIHAVSRDARGWVGIPLATGGAIGALEIQHAYLAAVEAHADAPWMPAWSADLCREWRLVLDDLAADPERLVGLLDWPTKRHLYQAHCRRRGFAWQDLERWGRALHHALARVDTGARRRRRTRPPDLRPLIKCHGPSRALLAGTLAGHGLALDDLEAFSRLRDELFELDLRFGELGRDSLFATLERDGLVARGRVGEAKIRRAMTQPPPGHRAERRAGHIRRLHQRRPRFRCHWDRIWCPDAGLSESLADPFAGPGASRRGAGAGEPRPSPAAGRLREGATS